MLFNSFTFIIFFAVVFALYQIPFAWRTKKIILVVASYIFYAWWNPPFVFLLWLVTLIDWFIAKWIYATPEKRNKKRILLISLATNLGILGYFKYGDFLLRNFAAFVNSFGIAYAPPESNIILPIGISFYTFVTISYTVDVYRGEIKPAKSFVDYCLLVTFFPHLVAGPILRAAQFLPQCIEPKKATSQQINWGLALFVFGLFEKVILADGLLAPVADKVFHQGDQAGWQQAWLGITAFAVQIFLDFDGYSLCAIGIALCFGFAFPDNFRFPFGAVGFIDLWQRWHISLTTWFRDYVFNSLPKKRNRIILYGNILITMLLSGLWHGAAWNYVAWGGVHGVCLIIERLSKRSLKKVDFGNNAAVIFLLTVLTFFATTLSAGFFRAPGLGHALTMYRNILTGRAAEIELYYPSEAACAVSVIVGIFFFHWLMRDSSLEKLAAKLHWSAIALIIAVMLIIILLNPGGSRAFVYFQF